MVEIVDIVISFLCQQNTQSQCQQFISTYPDVTQQLVWLIFFPTVFIVIFSYLLAEGVVKGVGSDSKKKFQTLVGVAIFLFIIFQGWYHIFLVLSRSWFIVLIVLSGFFVIIHHMGGGRSEAGGSRNLAFGGGAGNYLKKRVHGKISGKEGGHIRNIEDGIRTLKATASVIKHGGDARGIAANIEQFREERRAVEEEIRLLQELYNIDEIKTPSHKIEEWKNQITKLIKDIDRAEVKYRKAS